jgi:dTDP-4-dehydrorhamnose reductase
MTGADGGLGTEMQKILRRHNISYIASDLNQLDIGDFKNTNEILLKHRPDTILHFAAISDVDQCETNKELAHRVNAMGTMGLAIIAKKLNAKMLYVSTNFVFDGTSENPYSEHSMPGPVNIYGRTKLLGENHVKEICDRFYIVRTSCLFSRHAKTFMSRFIMNKEKPGSINALCDVFASFTYTVDLAEAIFTLIKSENYGFYHIVNKGFGSWLDFAIKAQEIQKFKTSLNPTKIEELNLAAARPRFTPLESNNYEFLFQQHMRPWEQALAEFINNISND